MRIAVMATIKNMVTTMMVMMTIKSVMIVVVVVMKMRITAKPFTL